jgi:hypothetical protein
LKSRMLVCTTLHTELLWEATGPGLDQFAVV